MKQTNLTRELFYFFMKNLRYEDKLELDEFLKSHSIDELYYDCIDENNFTYFLTTDENIPIALGGAYKINDNAARVWLLSTNEIYKNKVSVFKFIKNRIIEFKNRFNVLYNYIFKSNFSSLGWLQECGFNILELKHSDYKLFYFTKGDNCFDIRYFTC